MTRVWYVVWLYHRKRGETYFKVSPGEELLAAAQKLRHYLKDSNNAAGKFIGLFRNREPISPEEFQQMTVQRMENTGKVAGVFDIDFDKREFSRRQCLLS